MLKVNNNEVIGRRYIIYVLSHREISKKNLGLTIVYGTPQRIVCTDKKCIQTAEFY